VWHSARSRGRLHGDRNDGAIAGYKLIKIRLVCTARTAIVRQATPTLRTYTLLPNVGAKKAPPTHRSRETWRGEQQ
jgi:hypothetical protein